MEPTLRFTKVRNVKSPNRAHHTDAGIDFYVPYLTYDDIFNIQVNKSAFNRHELIIKENNHEIWMMPQSRILIPSGIKVLIQPENSMLMAANKSGIATKEGLLYTAEIVDSPYTGEVHLGVFNSGREIVKLNIIEVQAIEGKKLIQFIHVPIFLTELEEIPQQLYNEISETWGTRGSGGFGSTDKK